MKPIVTLTMNPSVDESTSVSHVVADRKLRCATPTYEPGGGGINVSRVIKILGGETLAVYPIGGLHGQMFQRLLNESGVESHPIVVKELTRMDLMVTEESTGAQYRFGTPGPNLKGQEWRRCLAELKNIGFRPEYIVASGSLPPGVPEDFYRMVADISHELGARIVIDTSGRALLEATKGGVFLFKPNMAEFHTMIGTETHDETQMETEAMKIIRDGRSEVIVVSWGAGGAFVYSKEGVGLVRAPAVPMKSKVGAGDSTVAGIVLGLARGMPLGEAVRFGVAAGSATVMTPGTQLCRREDVERLYESMTIRKV